MNHKDTVLIIGSSGFVGKAVLTAFSGDSNFIVYGANRTNHGQTQVLAIDLEDRKSIKEVLTKIRPTIIINCAGVVDNSDASQKNRFFSMNLLEEIISLVLRPKMVIISGSAAEYGYVSPENIPVKEDTQLNANSGYGLSKLLETSAALNFSQKYKIPVVIARIFNPIGTGMNSRFLLPSIMMQIHDIKMGNRDSLELNRLDSKRDYVHVNDVAEAIKCLASSIPEHNVYNIGSGKSTSNKELIKLLLDNSGVHGHPKVIEIMPNPEKLVAIQADITRITQEFGWGPKYTIKDTIEEIAHAQRWQ